MVACAQTLVRTRKDAAQCLASRKRTVQCLRLVCLYSLAEVGLKPLCNTERQSVYQKDAPALVRDPPGKSADKRGAVKARSRLRLCVRCRYRPNRCCSHVHQRQGHGEHGLDSDAGSFRRNVRWHTVTLAQDARYCLMIAGACRLKESSLGIQETVKRIDGEF